MNALEGQPAPGQSSHACWHVWLLWHAGCQWIEGDTQCNLQFVEYSQVAAVLSACAQQATPAEAGTATGQVAAQPAAGTKRLISDIAAGVLQQTGATDPEATGSCAKVQRVDPAHTGVAATHGPFVEQPVDSSPDTEASHVPSSQCMTGCPACTGCVAVLPAQAGSVNGAMPIGKVLLGGHSAQLCF